jgi:putative lipase involved disintegration of autophagic bodies
MSILFDDMPLTRLALGLQLALKDLSDNYGDLGREGHCMAAVARIAKIKETIERVHPDYAANQNELTAKRNANRMGVQRLEEMPYPALITAAVERDWLALVEQCRELVEETHGYLVARAGPHYAAMAKEAGA